MKASLWFETAWVLLLYMASENDCYSIKFTKPERLLLIIMV